jgi:hypothetical protein
MATKEFNFTTGPATLLDVGILTYNGCTFSPLFETSISGNVVRDNAQRTTKLIEYTLTVDGYVTCTGLELNASILGAMNSLRQLLTAQAGALTYQGRGFDLVINQGAGGIQDAVWGPVPELLEFQPLGAGNSAKVRWTCKVRIPEIKAVIVFTISSPGGKQQIQVPILQFNYDTVVSYGEDSYSSLAIKGTLEIPLTRPSQTNRKLTYTVDNLRSVIESVTSAIDLTRFRVTRREFLVSRDKRTMEWSFAAEELPYMNLPPDCTIARGTYSVRPSTLGLGMANWLCSLRSTYTVNKNESRRVAWFAFLALLRERMRYCVLGGQPQGAASVSPWPAPQYGPSSTFWKNFLQKQNNALPKSIATQAWLTDFSFDEGLYLDSKTTSFSATWRLVSRFDLILRASGLWAKLPEKDTQKNNLWKASMRNVMGTTTPWLTNRLDPSLDVIIDFGGN